MTKEEAKACSAVLSAAVCVPLLIIAVLAWGSYLLDELAAIILGAFGFWTVSQTVQAVQEWKSTSAESKAEIFATWKRGLAFFGLSVAFVASVIYAGAHIIDPVVSVVACLCITVSYFGLIACLAHDRNRLAAHQSDDATT